MREALIYLALTVEGCGNRFNRAPCLAAIEGQLLASTYSYSFQGTVLGFAAAGATFGVGADAGVLTETLSDPMLRSPAGLTINGSVDRVIRLDVERLENRTSGIWDGKIFYSTSGGGAHGESGSYYQSFSDIPLGQRVTVELDMSALTAGGTDWITHTVTQIRIDFDNGPGGVFKIYSVQVGHYASADEATGSAKCFNTWATCQDQAHFTRVQNEIMFALAAEYRPLGVEAIPCIKSVDFTPATINPGQDLGSRASLRVTFKDHPTPDTGMAGDPYFADRAYNPYEQGSFWPKFRARQPYLRGEPLVWYQGFVGDDLADMERRTFIVESFDGPSADGTYTLIAHDMLKMLDGDRAQAPFVSAGRLNADITDVQTTAVLSPVGVGATYPGSGYLAIGGNEIVSFSRSGDDLTIARPQLGSKASAHKATDKVQIVLDYVSADPADIIRDWMVNFAGVDPAYIPLDEWQAETAAYLKRTYTGTLAEPKPVAQLVAELMRDCGLSIWWDDLAQLIRLRVLRPIPTEAVRYDETLMVKGKISISDQQDKRVSQVWVSYGQIDPTQEDAKANFRATAATVDLASEANYGQSKIEKIASRWIPSGGLSAAQRVADMQLSRFATPPRLFKFTLFRDAQTAPQLGDGCRISHRTLQDATGARVDVPAQIIRVKPMPEGFEVWAEEFTFAPLDLDNRSITVNYDTTGVNIRTMHDESYPDPTPGTIVNFEVVAGVYVGSTSTSVPALQTGTWPTKAVTGNRTSGSPTLTGIADTTDLFVNQRVSGTGIPNGAKIISIVPNTSITLDKNASSGSGTSTALTVALVILNVTIKGNVFGRGGNGGRGANGQGGIPGQAGGAGGKAFKVDYPIYLTDTAGLTGGGGGGGGGGPCRDPSDHKGGGGGGGQGELGGDGGEGPGNGREGTPGSRTAGGVGGHGWTNNNFFSGPRDDPDRRGGNGGLLGQNGQGGQGSSDEPPGAGGAAGASIDGISKVVTVGVAGDRRGGQIN